MMKKVLIFFGSAVVAGLIGFFIQRSLPALQPQHQQAVEQAGPVVNPDRDPFPKETGNPPEETPDGQPIDVPYLPPAQTQNQQNPQGQSEQQQSGQNGQQSQSGQQQDQQAAQNSDAKNQPAQPASSIVIEQIGEDPTLTENL